MDNEAMRNVLAEIASERGRQQQAEGWTPEHDDTHDQGELARAGGTYAIHAALYTEGHPPAIGNIEGMPPAPWPFEASFWKPKGPRRDLVRAAALIVAEIERLDRAEKE